MVGASGHRSSHDRNGSGVTTLRSKLAMGDTLRYGLGDGSQMMEHWQLPFVPYELHYCPYLQ